MKNENWAIKHPLLIAIITFFVLVLLVNIIAVNTTETTSTSQLETPKIETQRDNSAETISNTEPKEEAEPRKTKKTHTKSEEEVIIEETTSAITVTRVIDGDTIEISTGERVRLICIDTPETYEDYYQEAKDYLTDLILNEKIELVKDKSEVDRYDRLLRYIYLDGDFINEMIVEDGWAVAYPYNPDITLCPQIEEAEEYAKSGGLGIWDEYEEPEELSDDSSDYICSSNYYNCGDFSTHAEAQAVFDACGSGDVHKLDRDNDGSACETLP